jgi:4-hydroxybenzoate polyprenyltransferase/phosphoserine phosphatase
MSAASSKPPLAVDMDGTLLKTDMFFESLASALFRKPLRALMALAGAIKGRARVKRAMAELGPVEVSSLPVRPELVAFIRAQRAEGRPVHLVTAADEAVAQKVAAHVGLFDGVFGSKGELNLKGSHKRDFLKRTFPEGYTYAGDSPADLSVWKDAASVVIAGASIETARRAESLGRPIEQRFDIGGAGLRDWAKALRLHQWVKNILVFVPLLLAHAYFDGEAVLRTFAAFVCLGFVASGSYILNDLSDLAADRAHRTKKNRAFAAGRLKVAHGLMIGPALIGLGLGLSLFVNAALAVALGAYLVLTLAYSLRLKRLALVDVMALAGLFTLRLGIGAAAAEVLFSPWLLTFSMLFFLSLSLAKRHVEVLGKIADGKEGPIPGRGYETRDWPLILGLGLATAVASAVILVLYLVEEAFPAELYAHPGFLWAAPVIVGLWVMRIWLLASRGGLDDDPVAFAVRDPLSIGMGAAAAGSFVAASVAVEPWINALF